MSSSAQFGLGFGAYRAEAVSTSRGAWHGASAAVAVPPTAPALTVAPRPVPMEARDEVSRLVATLREQDAENALMTGWRARAEERLADIRSATEAGALWDATEAARLTLSALDGSVRAQRVFERVKELAAEMWEAIYDGRQRAIEAWAASQHAAEPST